MTGLSLSLDVAYYLLDKLNDGLFTGFLCLDSICLSSAGSIDSLSSSTGLMNEQPITLLLKLLFSMLSAVGLNILKQPLATDFLLFFDSFDFPECIDCIERVLPRMFMLDRYLFRPSLTSTRSMRPEKVLELYSCFSALPVFGEFGYLGVKSLELNSVLVGVHDSF